MVNNWFSFSFALITMDERGMFIKKWIFFDFFLFLLFSSRFYIMNREEQIGGEKVR